MADQERDLDAAERALGLSEAEVPAAALARWEARLGGLAAAVPPVAPSAGLLDGVLARVRGQAPALPAIVHLHHAQGLAPLEVVLPDGWQVRPIAGVEERLDEVPVDLGLGRGGAVVLGRF